MVVTRTHHLETSGQGDTQDVTRLVAQDLAQSNLSAGIVTIAVTFAGVVCALSFVGASAPKRSQLTEQAVLYAGPDFGVRVFEPTKGNRPQATPVIRINRRWQEVELNAWTTAPDNTQQTVLYAGQDFGVRVRTPMDGNLPQATPMIRINGRWQVVQLKTWGDARALMQRPVLYTGGDFGVRAYTPTTSSQAVATPVIRINGKWQEVELKPGPAK